MADAFPAAPDRTFAVIVREVVEFRVKVDPDSPEWSPYLGSEEDWVADLGSYASETDGAVERAVRSHDRNVIGAWREVEWDDEQDAKSVRDA